MVVEGGAVEGSGFGDVLDGDVFEFFVAEESFEGVLQQAASAADTRGLSVDTHLGFQPYPSSQRNYSTKQQVLTSSLVSC